MTTFLPLDCVVFRVQYFAVCDKYKLFIFVKKEMTDLQKTLLAILACTLGLALCYQCERQGESERKKHNDIIEQHQKEFETFILKDAKLKADKQEVSVNVSDLEKATRKQRKHSNTARTRVDSAIATLQLPDTSSVIFTFTAFKKSVDSTFALYDSTIVGKDRIIAIQETQIAIRDTLIVNQEETIKELDANFKKALRKEKFKRFKLIGGYFVAVALLVIFLK